jgi:hypothetical protein
MPHKGKVRYRRWDVGEKGRHYLQVAYKGAKKLVEVKLKAYKGKKGKGAKDIQIFPKPRKK